VISFPVTAASVNDADGRAFVASVPWAEVAYAVDAVYAAVPSVPPAPHVNVPALLTPLPPRVDERIAEREAAVPVVFWLRVGTSAATIERSDGTPALPFGVAQKRFAAPEATVDEYKELTALSPVLVPDTVAVAETVKSPDNEMLLFASFTFNERVRAAVKFALFVIPR
jgi:hypothetical protein